MYHIKNQLMAVSYVMYEFYVVRFDVNVRNNQFHSLYYYLLCCIKEAKKHPVNILLSNVSLYFWSFKENMHEKCKLETHKYGNLCFF